MWNFIARISAKPAIANWLIKIAMRRPYSPIIKNGQLYMERFWLFNPYPDTGASGADRKRWQFPISIRIHHILLPDQDRHLHDHPWNARTVILKGGYIEQRIFTAHPKKGSVWEWLASKGKASWSETHSVKKVRSRGVTATLAYGEYHRIIFVPPDGCWTLFITGRYRGTWGFDVDGKKVKWRKYLGME